MKNSKAETIKNLENKLLNFYVPKTYFFNYVDWRNNSKRIFKDIKRVTNKNKIAIRSSAYDEDTDNESQAGKYLSFLNVNKSNKKEVKEKIEKVFKSYGSNIKIKKGQILIQEMIRNIKMSGVIMTQDLENSSPYYCINYDDITGSSDTVTSGKGEYANKSLYLLRGKEKRLKSNRFIKLIKAVQELEKKLKSDRLDIEFVLTKKNKLFLLQVRPLSKKKNLESNHIKKISLKVTSLEKSLIAEFKKSNSLYGSKNILGQMPDWNPVEMIGLHPSNLAYSLYDYLITDRSWYESRKLMGYKKINKTKLMLKLCGKPFIDIRKSFNSFLPDKINKLLGNKIINLAMDKLREEPNLHDKIEFEIIPNCFSFDFERKFKKIYNNLNKEELQFLKNEYKKIFIKNLNPNGKGSLAYNIKKIQELQSRQNFNNNYKHIHFSNIKSILDDCKFNGIIPFGILARHAFVAKEILNSLVRLKIFKPSDIEIFEKNIRTITSEFLIDLNNLRKNKIKRKVFLLKYGHLRPGTYDINSKSYKETSLDILINNKIKINLGSIDKIKLKLRKHESKINNLLRVEKIPLNYSSLVDYLALSLSSREKAKFVFSKNISLVIDLIRNISKKNKLKLKFFDNLNIQNLFIKNYLKKSNKLKSIKNEKIFNINRQIKLPQLIYDPSYINVIPFQVNFPNFITLGKVTAKANFINSMKDKNKLKGSIVLIENADPGYDWIFGLNVKGLITKFGGANSHMAIRCAELGMPAAIGCGEQSFKHYIKSKVIELNCKSKTIKVLS